MLPSRHTQPPKITLVGGPRDGQQVTAMGLPVVAVFDTTDGDTIYIWRGATAPDIPPGDIYALDAPTGAYHFLEPSDAQVHHP